MLYSFDHLQKLTLQIYLIKTMLLLLDATNSRWNGYFSHQSQWQRNITASSNMLFCICISVGGYVYELFSTS